MSLTPALAVEHPEVAALVPWLLGLALAMVVGAVVTAVCFNIVVVRQSRSDREVMLRLRHFDFKDAGRRLLVARRSLRILAVLLFMTWAVPYLLGQTGRAMNELVFVVIYACMFAPVYVVTGILGAAFQRLGMVLESHQRGEPGAI